MNTKDTQQPAHRPTARILKFRRKTPQTLEALLAAIRLDADTPSPPWDELILMLRPGKKARQELAEYRRLN